MVLVMKGRRAVALSVPSPTCGRAGPLGQARGRFGRAAVSSGIRVRLRLRPVLVRKAIANEHMSRYVQASAGRWALVVHTAIIKWSAVLGSCMTRGHRWHLPVTQRVTSEQANRTMLTASHGPAEPVLNLETNSLKGISIS